MKILGWKREKGTVLQPKYPDKCAFEKTADQQSQSFLFARLPPSIRQQIYIEVWRLSSLIQHICESPTGEGITHWPCTTNHDGEDTRQQALADYCDQPHKFAIPALFFEPQWHARLKSTWANHWQCEERMKLAYNMERLNGTPRQPREGHTSFLAVLLTCKLFYVEAINSMYDNTTFVIPATSLADRLLNRHVIGPYHLPHLAHPFSRLVRHLQIALYAHADDDAGSAPPHIGITTTSFPWRLLEDLGPQLRSVHIWLQFAPAALDAHGAFHLAMEENRICAFMRLLEPSADLALSTNLEFADPNFWHNESRAPIARTRRGRPRFGAALLPGFVRDYDVPAETMWPRSPAAYVAPVPLCVDLRRLGHYVLAGLWERHVNGVDFGTTWRKMRNRDEKGVRTVVALR